MSDETRPPKDLTGILDLPSFSSDSPTEGEPEDFATSHEPSQINSFESLDQLGSLPEVEVESEPESELNSGSDSLDQNDSIKDDFAASSEATPESQETSELGRTAWRIQAASGGLPLEEPSLEAPAPNESGPPSALDQVKSFSENVTLGTPQVEAAYPFTLSIEGTLSPQEKEKLLDVVHRHQMGFSEMDLEPQLAAGRVLLPRISEYAGVLVVQALRAAQVNIRFGPSDSIFSTDDTRTPDDESLRANEATFVMTRSDRPDSAERIPVTTGSSLPGIDHFEVLDVVTASATLRSNQVQAENSPQYQELVDSLTREIKYKAFRKGATAILNFEVTLTQLQYSSEYRMTIIGSAVKGT